MMKMMQLSEFTYTPNYTEEDFKRAEEFLLALPEISYGTSNFALVSEGRPYFSTGQACHAGLASRSNAGSSLIATEAMFDSRNRRADHKPLVLTSTENTSIVRKDRKEGVVDGFWNWFVHESLFGQFILNRNLPSVKLGWIISTDLPPALTQALAIVGRNFYELLDRAFIAFDDLVSAGVPKSVAYVTAINCYYSYSYMPRKHDGIYTPLYQHRMFSFPSQLGTLQNFAAGVYREDRLKTSSYRVSPSIYGCGELFGGNDVGSSTRPFTYELLKTDKELKEFLKGLRGDAKVFPTISNPFKRSIPSDTEDPFNVNNQEMFEIIKFMTNRGDFKNAVH